MFSINTNVHQDIQLLILTLSIIGW